MAQKTALRCDDRQLLAQLITKHDELRRWPTRKEIIDDPNLETPHRYETRFGSMTAAREAAWLMAGRLTNAQMEEVLELRKPLLRRLRRRHDQGGNLSRYQIAQDRKMPPLTEYSRYCGGIDEALRMLCLPVTIPNREDLIVAIQRYHQKYGRVPTVADCHDGECDYAMSAFRGAFETWNNAIIAAGFQPNLDQPNRRETLRKRRAYPSDAISA